MPKRKRAAGAGRPPNPLGASRDSPNLNVKLDAEAEAALAVIMRAEDCEGPDAARRSLVAYAKRLDVHAYSEERAAVERRRLGAR